MDRKVVLLPGLATTGVALAAAVVGCGGPVSPSATRLAASHETVVRPTNSERVSAASSSPGLEVRIGSGARANTPPASLPVTPSAVPSAAAPRSAAPNPASSPHATGAALAEGLYTDAPDGLPHYVIALSLGKGDAITGSVNFLYQDGRIGTVGQYTGELSSNGKLTIVFGGGKGLVGTYAKGALTLASCRSVLTWAVKPADCRFTYHGHVP